MPTHFSHVIIDAADAGASARWWSEALGWPVTFEEPDEVVIEPPEADGVGFPLVFCPVPEPKRGKNRVHLDLRSASDAEQADLVERLVRQGANPADIGQRDTPWVVLADPEGNEFCVLDPRELYTAADTGAIAAIVVDAVDPPALARFWAEATGWDLARSSAPIASLRDPSGTGPFIEFVHVAEPNPVKNRLHLDVAPFAGGDRTAEVARLLSLGATPADVGQGDDVTWVVLADPEGNEFCVLSPRRGLVRHRGGSDRGMSEDGDGQGGWQAAVARRLHQEGLDLAEDGQRRAVMLGMMDAAAYPLLANWLGWLARQTGDHDALAANLGQFGAALLNRTEGRHRYPVLASGHLTLDPEAFANLVLLTAALLKYIDWQAGQAEADAAGAFHASADEAITRLVEQTGAGLATHGDLAGYLAALTPGRFIGAPLLELQEQSERQGMGIFG